MRLFLGVSLTVEVGQPLPLMLSEQSRGLVCVCATAERVSHGGAEIWKKHMGGGLARSPWSFSTSLPHVSVRIELSLEE